MTTNIQCPDGDLDVLFAVRSTTKRADVGILSNGGVDISNRFETRGATTARANTNIQSGGADLATLFKDIGSGTTFPVTSRTVSAARTAPASATAGWQLDTAGNVFINQGAGMVDSGEDWIAPTSGASGYSCKATLVSGTTPTTGTMATVLALTSTRSWTNTQPGSVGTTSSVISVDIIRNSDSAVMKTVQITITADVSP